MHACTFIAPLLVIFAAASPMVKRDAITVEADLATVITNVKILNTTLVAFLNTSGTLAQALDIQTDIIAVNSSMAKTITDVQNSISFNETDSDAILSDIETLDPVSLDALAQLIKAKPEFDRIGFSFIILFDLISLNSTCTALEKALLVALSPDDSPKLNPLIQATSSAISKAIVVYSGASTQCTTSVSSQSATSTVSTHSSSSVSTHSSTSSVSTHSSTSSA